MGMGFFIAGTDTGVGKTVVTCALLHAFSQQGKKVIGMKPVAAGCDATSSGLQCEDVVQLQMHSNVDAPPSLTNPYALSPAIAPHIAAEQTGVAISLTHIASSYKALQEMAGIVLVEGVGGLMVPLNASQDTADLALMLNLPVILVVGMRLGCINHALLTALAIRQKGLRLAAWVANQIDPDMQAVDENLRALETRIGAPLLGFSGYSLAVNPSRVSNILDINILM